MKRIIGAVAAVLAVVIILLWQPWRTSPITAQVPAPQEPEQPQAAPLVSLAEMQSRLSDDDLVTAALKRAANALASSEKEPQFSEDACAADAKIKAIYRGMILAHAGYYLVMADLRSGDYQNYGFLPADEAELNTNTLLSHWSKERVARIWQSSNALNALSAEDRSSIAAFLNELKLFKPIYLSVKRTNPDFDALDQDAVDGILQKRAAHPSTDA
jgi:hypothetical protein